MPTLLPTIPNLVDFGVRRSYQKYQIFGGLFYFLGELFEIVPVTWQYIRTFFETMYLFENIRSVLSH